MVIYQFLQGVLPNNVGPQLPPNAPQPLPPPVPPPPPPAPVSQNDQSTNDNRMKKSPQSLL